MSKIKIKNFALDIRKQLTSGVIKRVAYLKNASSDSELVYLLSKEEELYQLIEEVVYTWFVRLIAIRLMEVNKYINCNIKDKTFDKANFIKTSDYLTKIMPSIFEKIENYKYLLLPNNMFGEESIVSKFVEGIEDYYWKVEFSDEEVEKIDLRKEHGVEIIGWLYQYYFSIDKEEIFAELKKKKLTKQNIPVATQIFTPKWIVKYMVENTLGKLWLESYSDKKLIYKWKYILDNGVEVKKFKNTNLNPEKITVLDPAMGSGNILIYAFDVLYDIYYSLGYPKEKIPIIILEKNLYGLDIDSRVSKLALFALIMKARSKNKNIFNYTIKLNLISIQESNDFPKKAIEYFCNTEYKNYNNGYFKKAVPNLQLKKDIKYLIDVFKDAKEYGALLDIKPINFESLERRIEEIKCIENLDSTECKYKKIILEKIPILVEQAKLMSQKYDVVVANPPYSGLRKFNNRLKKFVEKHYKDYKYDLFSIFMVRNMNFTKDNGFAGFMTPNVWQFISSYEDLRNNIIDNYQMLSLVQLDDDGFKDASVSISTFVIRKCNKYTKSIFIKLDSASEQQNKAEGQVLKDNKSKFIIDQMVFKRLPCSKMAFWIKEHTIKTFENGKNLKEIGKPRQGLATSDNNRFLRYWYEVNKEKICFPNENSNICNYKWIPYNKGGGYRKWYGNNYFVIDWENNGYELKEYAKNLYGNYSRTIKNEEFYFKQGITYNFIGSNISPRISPKGFIFDVAGSMIFVKEDKIYYILGLLGSKLSNHYIEILNPSLNIQVGDIKNIPVIEPSDVNIYKDIENLVIENIDISKKDWDSFETSWDFKTTPILNHKLKAKTVKEAYENWAHFTESQFNRLKENEEKLNSIYIDIYGIEGELNPKVEDKDISIRKANEEKDIKSFISYAVGCMFGRYSLDEEGIIYAGGSFKDKFKLQDGIWYLKVGTGWKRSSINIVKNNIIPITKDGLCKDNITSRFIDFLKTTFGEETLEENLNYIGRVLYGKTNKTPYERLNYYFMKDFFLDHVKTYQKRPIYWLLDGGKKDESKFLIYIHRHEELLIDKIKNINLDDGIKKNFEKIIND